MFFESDDVLYNLKNQSTCNHSIPCTETNKKYGIEAISYIGQKIWDKVHTEIKIFKSLEEFKVQIKGWVPETALARYLNCSLNMQLTLTMNIPFCPILDCLLIRLFFSFVSLNSEHQGKTSNFTVS